MATLLVIGGTGFFGKSILDSYKRNLLNYWKIDKVIIMSRNARKFEKHYPELCSKGVEFLIGDISTIDFLPDADFVIHAAASTDNSKYLDQNDDEKNNIIAGTLNYCRLAKKFHKKKQNCILTVARLRDFWPQLLICQPFASSPKHNVKKSYGV